MTILKTALISIVALLHIYFLVLEMFLWTKPRGLKTFRMTIEQAQSSAVLAANQGLYNGFLAAGLIWSLLSPSPDVSRQFAIFCLGCVIVAAIYGAYSVNRRILFIQGVPGILAILAVLLA